MAIAANLESFHKSIAGELSASQDRVRNLIGARHWQSDGEHKEWIVRKTLRAHAPESVGIGRGFVCVPRSHRRDSCSTSQIDILAVSREKATLLKEDDFYIVTPDAVRAVVEVKTSQGASDLHGTLQRLAEDIGLIRGSFCGPWPLAGLFVYEDPTMRLEDQSVLDAVQSASGGEEERAIDLVALGANRLFCLLERGEAGNAASLPSRAWYSFDHQDKAHSYFLASVALKLEEPESPLFEKAWFPTDGPPNAQYRRYLSVDGSQSGGPG